jgi:hypothetical protein
MKIRISLFIVFTCFFVFDSTAQDAKKSTLKLMSIDAPNAVYDLYMDISRKLYTGLEQNKISAFSSESLNSKLSFKQVQQAGAVYDTVQMQDPNMPGDPYSLVDTVVVSLFFWDNVERIVVGKSWIQYYMSEKKIIYLQRPQAEAMLNAREKALLAFAEKRMGGRLSMEQIMAKCLDLVKELSMGIYETALKGKVKAYRSDSLKEAYNLKEVANLGGLQEMWQIINPLNPTDPYDLIDTVINTPFVPDSLNTFRVSVELSGMPDYAYKLQVMALAPAYRLMVGGLELPESPMFWAKRADLAKALSKEHNDLLDIIIPYAIRRTLALNHLEFCIPYEEE